MSNPSLYITHTLSGTSFVILRYYLLPSHYLAYLQLNLLVASPSFLCLFLQLHSVQSGCFWTMCHHIDTYQSSTGKANLTLWIVITLIIWNTVQHYIFLKACDDDQGDFICGSVHPKLNIPDSTVLSDKFHFLLGWTTVGGNLRW